MCFTFGPLDQSKRRLQIRHLGAPRPHSGMGAGAADLEVLPYEATPKRNLGVSPAAFYSGRSGCGSTLNHQGTAGFHLPGFHFGVNLFFDPIL